MLVTAIVMGVPEAAIGAAPRHMTGPNIDTVAVRLRLSITIDDHERPPMSSRNARSYPFVII